MDLKTFISETLIQISEGVEDAQKRLKEQGLDAVINTNMTETAVGHLVTGGRRRSVEFVEFNVAVLATEGKETKAGVGVAVASILNLNAGGKSNESLGRETRIKFKIPMSYPVHKYTEAGEST
jgi:predicted ATP-dependent Lon-type protease